MSGRFKAARFYINTVSHQHETFSEYAPFQLKLTRVQICPKVLAVMVRFYDPQKEHNETGLRTSSATMIFTKGRKKTQYFVIGFTRNNRVKVILV